jgi:hypothetical protein
VPFHISHHLFYKWFVCLLICLFYESFYSSCYKFLTFFVTFFFFFASNNLFYFLTFAVQTFCCINFFKQHFTTFEKNKLFSVENLINLLEFIILFNDDDRETKKKCVYYVYNNLYNFRNLKTTA